MKRTGSFPLMAIAASYEVDYGDVLLVGMAVMYAGLPHARLDAAYQATNRLFDKLGATHFNAMVEVMMWTLPKRWWPRTPA